MAYMGKKNFLFPLIKLKVLLVVVVEILKDLIIIVLYVLYGMKKNPTDVGIKQLEHLKKENHVENFYFFPKKKTVKNISLSILISYPFEDKKSQKKG